MFKILDNRSGGKVGEELKASIKNGSKLSIIASTFTIYAYKHLREELDKIDKLRLLFGDFKPFSENGDSEKREFFIRGSKYELKLKNELKQSEISKECAEWIRNKVELKAYKEEEFLDYKLYHIDNGNEKVAIQGNSDFTSEGLGFENSPKMFSNMMLTDSTHTMTFLKQFEDIWNDKNRVKDVKRDVIEKLETLFKDNTPEFIYFVTLYNIFKDYLEEIEEDKVIKEKTGFKDTVVWSKLYKFQKDGVLGAIERLEKYNGCIIADSVGLGKTFEALAVIKYYELRNDRVLVIAPKKLHENWNLYRQAYKRNILDRDRFRYDLLNHTDLSRTYGISGNIDLKELNWGNYDLIVIDESHNFRNGGDGQRYKRLMDDIIKSGVKTKVLMLSATPVNNKFNDLKNQVMIITEGEDNHFERDGIKSVEYVMKIAQTQFNAWQKLDEEERTLEKLLELLNSDYFKILDMISIARSRKHIEKYYDVSEIGKFPKRRIPINEKPNIDTKNEFPELKIINHRLKTLALAIYSPSEYLLLHKIEEYSKYDTKLGNISFRQVDREKALVNLMRINILKRLESSVNSFQLTVSKIAFKIEKTIQDIDRMNLAQLEISEEDLSDFEDEEMTVGKSIKISLKDMDLIRWREVLIKDLETLHYLKDEALKINAVRDEKLQRLKHLISTKVKHPLNIGNKKVIVFTAFSDTAEYLYENIVEWSKRELGINSAVITGGTIKTNFEKSRKDFNEILTNFSPISKEREKIDEKITGEIDLLIATDCISEGQNLQDCDYLINYDIHWNPVRIIQRFGRIDRLGSKNDEIQLVNFWPDMDLDEYINLEARVKGRMSALDLSATGDDNVLDSGEMKDLEYRKKQLNQLKDQVVDLEDIKGGVSITDLNFNDFKMDLYEYAKKNRKELEEASLGMYSITQNSINAGEKGVIFCLKRLNSEKILTGNNALDPYFLIYIKNSGEVQYEFYEAKKILDLYRAVSLGKRDLNNQFINEFERETGNANDMSFYSELLKLSVESIIGEQDSKGLESIFKIGGTNLQNNFKGIEDFELVSFLIIK